MGPWPLCYGTESKIKGRRFLLPLTSKDAFWKGLSGLPGALTEVEPQHLCPQWEGAGSRQPLEGAPLAGLGHVSAALHVLGNLMENTAFPVMKWVGTSRTCDPGYYCGRDCIALPARGERRRRSGKGAAWRETDTSHVSLSSSLTGL